MSLPVQHTFAYVDDIMLVARDMSTMVEAIESL